MGDQRRTHVPSVATLALEDNPSARLGAIVGGKYRLEAVLGVGGMAFVYRARHVTIGRAVAIKILRPEMARQPQVVERFLREASTANLIEHPNVVDIIDVGRDDDEAESPYLVQEILQGVTLTTYVERHGGKLSSGKLMPILGEVLSAVAAAHERGIVHRDLKPDNVFIVRDRRGGSGVKVLDFGISKTATTTEETGVGVILGTPAYMAPELTREARSADARSDVWALGVMIHELAYGKLPFEGDSLEVLFERIALGATTIGGSDDSPLANVIEGCLAVDRAHRFADARALQRALEGVRFSVPRTSVPNVEVDETVPAAQWDMESAPRIWVRSKLPVATRSRPRRAWWAGFAVPALALAEIVSVGGRAVADPTDRQEARTDANEIVAAVASSSTPQPIVGALPVVPPLPIAATAPASAEPRAAAAPSVAATVERTPPRAHAAPPASTTKVVEAPPPDPATAHATQGTLTLHTVPWTKVYEGERLLGSTPLYRVPLSAGTHRLTLVNEEEGVGKVYTVTVKADEEVARRVALR